MNTTTTQNQPATRSRQRAPQPQTLSLESVRQRLEEHVRENPLKAAGQAVALGYVLRFLPIRGLLATGLRLAAPLMLLNKVWQSVDQKRSEE